MKNLIYITIISFFLIGCATYYGTKQLTTENIATIKKNQTTKSEIISLFGNPVSKIKSSLGEMWTYSVFESKGILVTKMISRSLTVTFDENGIVKDLSESEVNPIVPIQTSFY